MGGCIWVRGVSGPLEACRRFAKRRDLVGLVGSNATIETILHLAKGREHQRDSGIAGKSATLIFCCDFWDARKSKCYLFLTYVGLIS